MLKFFDDLPYSDLVVLKATMPRDGFLGRELGFILSQEDGLVRCPLVATSEG